MIILFQKKNPKFEFVRNTLSEIIPLLGCILFEMCACKRAFEAPTLPALIIRFNFLPFYAIFIKKIILCQKVLNFTQ